MTGLLASMMPRDPAASGAAEPSWRLVRDADRAGDALRAISHDAHPLDGDQAARALYAVVRAHSTVFHELFGPGAPSAAAAVPSRLRAQLATALVSVLEAALGVEMAKIAEESRLAIAGAILALAVAVSESPESYPPLTDQQRIDLLRSAIRGVVAVEGER